MSADTLPIQLKQMCELSNHLDEAIRQYFETHPEIDDQIEVAINGLGDLFVHIVTQNVATSDISSIMKLLQENIRYACSIEDTSNKVLN